MQFHTITHNANGTVDLTWKAPETETRVFKALQSEADAEMLATDMTAEYYIEQATRVLKTRLENTDGCVITYDGGHTLQGVLNQLELTVDEAYDRTVDAISLELD